MSLDRCVAVYLCFHVLSLICSVRFSMSTERPLTGNFLFVCCVIRCDVVVNCSMLLYNSFKALHKMKLPGNNSLLAKLRDFYFYYKNRASETTALEGVIFAIIL